MPERDAVNWAYTQINLGFILQDLAQLGDGDASEARQAFARVISEEQRISEKWLVGAAHCALGRLERLASEPSADEEAAAAESESEERRLRAEEIRRLEEARRYLETGIPMLAADDWLPTRRGRALDDLATVLTRLDRPRAAISVGSEALEIMRPTTAPPECLSIGRRLGGQLATEGQWEEAAAAFGDALEAAELSFHGRLDTAAREAEARRAGELARWAAFAFGQVGEPERAAVALESGRTRELRRRLGFGEAEEARLAELPEKLRQAFAKTSAALGSAPLDESAFQAGLALQEVLEEIRRHPGMDDFAAGSRWEDLVGAVDEKWPLVYVNPTPWGTLLLRLSVHDGETSAETLILESPSSLDVFFRLALGTALDPGAPSDATPASFLAAVDATGTAELQPGLEQSLPWLGEQICASLYDWLCADGWNHVTLVPCGPISTAPLGAATWEEGGEERCLLDSVAVRYAPSALLAAHSRVRATDLQDEARLLALADPDGSLRAAAPEVEEIAAYFDGHQTLASGDAATSDFLRTHLARATHLHLACHAQAGIFDEGRAGVILSDGLLPAGELPTLDATSLRLAVISACQSAVAEIVRLPNEVFAVSTALLAAGSACVVASLWPVDDDATAILMARFYEEMFTRGLEPPEALRSAQLWLRDLTERRKSKFLADHPSIAAEIHRRAAEGRPGHHRGAEKPGCPYSHPDFWAPFIALGA